jgi:hypothetical protein
MEDYGQVASIVQNHIEHGAVRPPQGLLDAPFILSSVSPFQARPICPQPQRRRHGLKKILQDDHRTSAPSSISSISTAVYGHMQATSDSCPFQRFGEPYSSRVPSAPASRRHFDLFASPGSQGYVPPFIVTEIFLRNIFPRFFHSHSHPPI